MRTVRPCAPVRLLVPFALLVAAGPALAGPARWTSVMRDADGWLVAAAGEQDGVPLRLTINRRFDEQRREVGLQVTFARGADLPLSLHRLYRAPGGLTMEAVVGARRLSMDLHRDPADGALEARFALPDGQRLQLIYDGAGGLLAGDPEAVRAALGGARRIGGMLAGYREAVEPILHLLPGGDSARLLSPGGCWDQCALGCPVQCAWECLIPGPFCDICLTSCALGCSIGCGPNLTPID